VWPLEGCRVVDACTYVAGPFATMMLADLGADVLKIEPPGGDPNRRFGVRHRGTGLLFVNTNRNKRSVELDVKDAVDGGLLQELIGEADVFAENWRPGVAARLGLTGEALQALNPRLIHLSITGYGPDGPTAQRGAFDSVVQGVSGLAWHNGREGRPELLRTYVADKVTSTFAAQAVLGALLARERTGAGQRVEVSMLDAATYFNFPDMLAERTVIGDDRPVEPEANPGRCTLIRASDGHLVVAPSSAAHVRQACDAVGHPEWVDDLAALRGFAALAPALMSRLESVTVTNTVHHWLAAFEAADVPAGPVHDVDAHLGDPQVLHNGTYAEIDHPELGAVRAPRFPVRMAGLDGRRGAPWPITAAPVAGQDGDRVRTGRRWRATAGGPVSRRPASSPACS
jgi:crotonobetainyl-CoA:carnitine CoA-transferase CaiB-like acyl-CoA transferase